MKKLTAFLAAILTGCAAQTMWVKDGATQADFDRDKAQCWYEANVATGSYSHGSTARTTSGAIAQGIGEGLAISMRNVEIATLCMQARGYRQVPIGSGQQPTAYTSRPAPSPATEKPAAAPVASPPAYGQPMNRRVEAEPPTPAKIGKYTIAAEDLAKSERCHPSPTVTLTATGPGFEAFTVPCQDGDALAVRCDFGNCRALK